MWWKHSLLCVGMLLLAIGCSQPASDSTDEAAQTSTTQAAPKKPHAKRSRTSEPLVNSSPQECFERMTEAADSNDVITLLECFAQEDRNRQVGMLAYHVERFIVFQTEEKDQALALLTKYHLEKTDIMGMMQIYDSPGGQGAAKAVEVVGSQIQDQNIQIWPDSPLHHNQIHNQIQSRKMTIFEIFACYISNIFCVIHPEWFECLGIGHAIQAIFSKADAMGSTQVVEPHA